MTRRKKQPQTKKTRNANTTELAKARGGRWEPTTTTYEYTYPICRGCYHQ